MMKTLENVHVSHVKRTGRLPRLAYLIITIGCFITAISLWLSGYHGYSGLLLAIGAAAAINLK
jgi:hypothetical protein